VTIGESLARFWTWANSKTVVPWVALVLSAVAAFAHFEAESKAQEVRVKEIKEVTTERMIDLRRDLEFSQSSYQTHILDSLSRIESSQKEAREELKAVKADMTSISADLDRVCYRVQADCKR
jgi:hypothetical protein